MKKIINKIKQNENLCKVLKVLKLVLDLVVYGFAIFMIIGLAIGQSYVHDDGKAQERQLIPNVATTPIKPVYSGNDYYVISLSGDIGTTNFITGFFEQYQKTFNDDENADLNNYATFTDWAYVPVNSSWTYFFSGNQGAVSPLCYYLPWELGTYSDLSSYNDTNNLITSFKFSLLSKNDYSMSSGLKMRIIQLRVEPLLSSGSSAITLDFLVNFYFDNSNNIKFWSIPSVSNANQSVFLLVNNNINNDILFNMLYNSVSNKVGYDKGFKVGYEKGVIASQQQQNGVFGLLKQAFQSVASVLNIQLIPGLNLGILIFAPLIVTIIVVIIKMFRG